MFAQKEMQAIVVGGTRKLLKKRLQESIAVLKSEYRDFFKTFTFDFENKRFVSSCGTYHLQWKLRKRPDQPESHENQQTSRGIVQLVKAN
jgi:hypothetical protein